jgi:hypothetical protein
MGSLLYTSATIVTTLFTIFSKPEYLTASSSNCPDATNIYVLSKYVRALSISEKNRIKKFQLILRKERVLGFWIFMIIVSFGKGFWDIL